MYSSYNIEYEYFCDNRYVLDECAQCGVIYQREIPDAFLLNKVYGEWLDIDTVHVTKKKTKLINRPIGNARLLIDILKYMDAPPGDIAVFDFGMGLGDWCRLAHGFGFKVSGNDISDERMEHARAAGIDAVSYEEIPSRKFDFINSYQVFEHLDEPLDTLNHLCKALKPNGIMRLAVPNGSAMEDRLAFWDLGGPSIPDETQSPFRQNIDQSLNPVSPFEHINCYDHDALVNRASNAGLTPISVPNWLVIANNQKLTMSGRIRAALRQFYYAAAAKKPARTGTDLIFKKTN
jgi:SAM-dependent methyltransferase